MGQYYSSEYVFSGWHVKNLCSASKWYQTLSMEHSSIDQCISEMIFFVVQIVNYFGDKLSMYKIYNNSGIFWLGRVKVAISFCSCIVN